MPGLTSCPNGELRLRDLSSHPAPYVTVDDLARYWMVSRRHIYKQIEEGKLPAIRLGPRSLRIRTSDATKFELRSMIGPSENGRKIRALPQKH
jgi:excisionase family DNA binding protein